MALAAVAVVVAAAVLARTAPARTTTPAPAVDSTARAPAAGLRIAERFRVDAITTRRFTHAEFWRAVAPFTGSASLSVEPIGRSVLGREIRSVTFGRGREVGNLQGAVAIDTVDAAGLFVHPDTAAVARDSDGVRLPVGAPARFDLRRGAGSASALVRRIGD